jgi:hypothetical protein
MAARAVGGTDFCSSGVDLKTYLPTNSTQQDSSTSLKEDTLMFSRLLEDK